MATYPSEQTRYFVDSAGICYATKPFDDSIVEYTKDFNFLMVKNDSGQYEIEILPDYHNIGISNNELEHWLKSGYWEEINFPFQLKPQFEYLGPEGKQK